MTLHQKIKGEIKEAMLAKDAVRLAVTRGLLAAFVNELVAKRRKPTEELKDDEALAGLLAVSLTGASSPAARRACAAVWLAPSWLQPGGPNR